MADTLRDLSALQAILADNTAGLISPQDIRDFLYSMKRPYGSIYETASAQTAIAVPGTYYKASMTTALSDNTSPYLFDMPVSNRLRYTGSTDCHVHVVCNFDLELVTGTNNVAGLRIYKNGTTGMVHSTVRRKIAQSSDIGAASMHADFMMSQNDYIEVWITNETDTNSIQMDNCYLFATGMFK